MSVFDFNQRAWDQLGGQLDAGFLIAGLYEDDWGGSEPIDQFIKCFVAVRAIKLTTQAPD
tara:strand:+ start:161 stop:340 length:180 start_codon:yes stop_codon:yes gene_type:complete